MNPVSSPTSSTHDPAGAAASAASLRAEPGRSILTGNDRSSGKSTVFLAIGSLACMLVREHPKLLDFRMSVVEYEDQPRLRGRLGQQMVIQHCPLQLGDLDLDATMAEGALGNHSYEPMLEAVSAGGHLGDLPANGLRGLVHLLNVTSSAQFFLGDGANLSFAVPATLDPVAMAHARAAAEAVLALAPKTRVWVYEIDAKGPFSSLADDDPWAAWRRRMQDRYGSRITFRSIPFVRMASVLLPLYRLDEMPKVTAEALLERLPHLRRLEAATYAKQLCAYGQATLEAVSDQTRWFLGLDD